MEARELDFVCDSYHGAGVLAESEEDVFACGRIYIQHKQKSPTSVLQQPSFGTRDTHR